GIVLWFESMQVRNPPKRALEKLAGSLERFFPSMLWPEQGSNPGNHERSERVQKFVEQVSKGEGWETPKVVIPSEEEFTRLAGQTDAAAGIPWKDIIKQVKGYASRQQKSIYINPRFIDSTTVLHELAHYNTTREDIMSVMERFKDKPELILTTLEIRAERKARRLARKYGKEWRDLVQISNPGSNPGAGSNPADPVVPYWVLPAAFTAVLVVVSFVGWVASQLEQQSA
ncbi:unnamed protein product, partial [marine sediment metagenome]